MLRLFFYWFVIRTVESKQEKCSEWKSWIVVLLWGSQIVKVSNTTLMSSIEAESTIQFAVGIFRHGIRSPYRFPYSQNPYEDFEKYFPEGPTKLTKLGKNLMDDVGGIFRTRYDKLLGDKYMSENVYFQSTASERTMMSTEIVAQSIYPPKSCQKWRENQTWHPIPVWTDYGDIDKAALLMKGDIKCPKYSKLLKETWGTFNTPDVTELYQPLSDYSGRILSKLEDLLLLYDNLHFQELNELPLPKWANKFYLESLRNLNNKVLKTCIAATEEVSFITSGTILHFVKNLLSTKANNTLKPNRKVFIHGGHDTSLVALLNGIGNDEPLENNPGAMLVFELHEVNKEYIVKAFYLDVISKDDTFKEISIPSCGKPCTLDAFLHSTKSVDHEEWKRRYSS